MQVGDIIKIKGTNTFWDDKHGKVEAIDDERNVATILVDFIPEEKKRIRQDFSLNVLSSSEIIEEAYRNKQTNEIGDIEKDFNNGFVLFKSDLGKSQVSKDDLEEVDDIEDVNLKELTHIETTKSFDEDYEKLLEEGHEDEIDWFLSSDGHESLSILRLKGFDVARRMERVVQETLSSNKKYKGNTTIYTLKKGKGSSNQFRAYFYRNGNTCVFVRCLLKKRQGNGPSEYKAIQDTIDYSLNNKKIDK